MTRLLWTAACGLALGCGDGKPQTPAPDAETLKKWEAEDKAAGDAEAARAKEQAKSKTPPKGSTE